jgi:DNA-directed RNA polymerase specialized sigma24 family protein
MYAPLAGIIHIVWISGLAGQEDVEMGVARKSQERHQIAPEAALAGVLALLVEARELRIQGNKDAVKTEVLLSSAGLSNEDIGAVMGKKAGTVRVALHRNSKSK